MNNNKNTEQSQLTEAGMHYTACCTLADCSHETNHEEQKIKNAKRGEFIDLLTWAEGMGIIKWLRTYNAETIVNDYLNEEI